MKTYMPLNGLRWSRNSGSANCDMPQSAVFGRPGGGGMLMLNVNELIKERKTLGLLFCKNELVKFYSKYGWQLIPKQALILEPGHDSINTMLFNCHVDGVLEYKDKLF